MAEGQRFMAVLVGSKQPTPDREGRHAKSRHGGAVVAAGSGRQRGWRLPSHVGYLRPWAGSRGPIRGAAIGGCIDPQPRSSQGGRLRGNIAGLWVEALGGGKPSLRAVQWPRVLEYLSGGWDGQPMLVPASTWDHVKHSLLRSPTARAPAGTLLRHQEACNDVWQNLWSQRYEGGCVPSQLVLPLKCSGCRRTTPVWVHQCTCGSLVAKWKREVGAHLGLSCALRCLCACLLCVLHAR